MGCDVLGVSQAGRVSNSLVRRSSQPEGKFSPGTSFPFSSRVVFPSVNIQLPALAWEERMPGTHRAGYSEIVGVSRSFSTRLARREGLEGCSTQVKIAPGKELEETKLGGGL